MSVHILTPKDQNHEVRVGWDRPFAVFFLQVFDLNHERVTGEERLIVDLTVTNPDLLLTFASGYAQFAPEPLLRDLSADQGDGYPATNRVKNWPPEAT